MNLFKVVPTFFACFSVFCFTTPGRANGSTGPNRISSPETCAALAAAARAYTAETVVVTTTKHHPLTEAAPPPPGSPPWVGGTPAMPVHCEVVGRVGERTGVDGQRYAIGFRLRLPEQWNGRYLFQGGGGTDGTVGDAIGSVAPGARSALDRGFAVITTDAGHDNRTNNDPNRQGQVAFGFDYQARVDYAERSLEVIARLGKTLIESFYGREPDYSYFFGCSNGGRQGMIFAQRFPELFDGIVASAPAFDVPKAAIAEVWDTQSFAGLASRTGLVDGDGLPLLGKTFTDADLALVAEAVLEACDESDGLKDGIAGDFTACTTERVSPVLAGKTCTDAKTTTCLTNDQVATLKRVFAGPTNSSGEPLYSDWPWDAGIGGKVGNTYQNGWRIWKIGTYDGQGLPFAINIILGSPAMSALFTTPPVPVPDDPKAHLRYQLAYDLDTDAPKIFATTAEFPKSSWELISAKATNLTTFQKRGGKLIVPHGVSDPIFSINDTKRWWDAVNGEAGGKAAEFVRLFPVPGLTHCGGGPATDRFDCLAVLVDWVEKGVAPDRIEAVAGDMTPWPGRTRPLCPYPQVARYTGSGSIEEARNFECR